MCVCVCSHWFKFSALSLSASGSISHSGTMAMEQSLEEQEKFLEEQQQSLEEQQSLQELFESLEESGSVSGLCEVASPWQPSSASGHSKKHSQTLQPLRLKLSAQLKLVSLAARHYGPCP